MKSSLVATVRFLLLALAAVGSQAATLYVATTGSDTAAGTQAQPLATLSRALALVKAGDTISLGGGTFTGAANTSVAGTVTSPITIQGAGAGATTYTGGLTVDMNYYTVRDITFKNTGISIGAATGVIIEKCIITRCGKNVNFTSSSSNSCIIRNNAFSHPGDTCMIEVKGTGHLFENNTYTGNNGWDAHRVNGVVSCTFRSNIFDGINGPNNNVTTSISSNTIGTGTKVFEVATGMGYEVDDLMHIAYTAGTANYINGWVVSYIGSTLTVEVFSTAGSGTYNAWTVDTVANGNHADIVQAFWYDSYNCVFERNRINNGDAQLGNFEAANDSGVAIGQVRDWTFRNNIFYNSRIQINVYAPGFKFYNNTVYNTPGTTGFRGATATKGNGNPVAVFNNIFCRVGNIESGGPYSGATADYNLITDYADDSKKTGYSETNGINGGFTPSQIFENPANGDLRIKVGSPAIGRGLPLSATAGFSDDYTGATRTGAWDMGAYIYGSSNALAVGTAPSNARINITVP